MSLKQPTCHELLLEIGTEELPPQFVAPALADLAERATRLFKEARLPYESIKTLGTPRRLTLVIAGLANHQEPIVTGVMGPSKSVGYDPDGKPTRAAAGFAASQGVPVTALEVRATAKGDYLFAIKKDPGDKTAHLLPALLKELAASLVFPKAMRWNDTEVRFARPIRWLLALYGGKPVRFQYAGLRAVDRTFGHRFLSAGRSLQVKDFNSYMRLLQKAGVVVKPDQRRAMIISQIERIAEQKGAHVHRDATLVEQAVFTVEIPHAVVGAFNSRYLSLPKEVLMTAMKEHQSYFSLLAEDGTLLPYFIAVANMRGHQSAMIRSGNERVLAARLADAKFFFDEDRKTPLQTRVEKLKGVSFHQKLGSLYQKMERMVKLAPMVASLLEIQGEAMNICRRAAELCKADLTTGMVGEFPTLQGVMGREYARHDGEPKEVADAIADHYLPRFAEDAIPPSPTGKVLSLVDRLDTLAAFFSVGLVPSGSQDPFALRRHAYAVVRILLEGGLSLNLYHAIQEALRLLSEQGIQVDDKTSAELQRFIGERLRYYCQEVTGLREDFVDAALSRRQSGVLDPLDVRARAQALQHFAARPEFESLVIACKRAENITKAHQEDHVDEALFQESVEKDLYEEVKAFERSIPELIEGRIYSQVLESLVSLKPAIDAFFNGVMVMAEDVGVRQNRLALLVRVRKLFRQYADFSNIRVSVS